MRNILSNSNLHPKKWGFDTPLNNHRLDDNHRSTIKGNLTLCYRDARSLGLHQICAQLFMRLAEGTQIVTRRLRPVNRVTRLSQIILRRTGRFTELTTIDVMLATGIRRELS